MSSTITPTSKTASDDAAHRADDGAAGQSGGSKDAKATTDRRARAAAPATSTLAPPKTRAQYRPDIDGIRGAAAIMVMGFHAAVPGFQGAYIGLDLFFVVSGYVITGLLLAEYERNQTIKWGAFYARRARRLIPAKATMLIGVLILSYFLLNPTHSITSTNGVQQQTAESAAWAAGFVSNIFFLRHVGTGGYFAHPPGQDVLIHTWSLAVEEQFYVAVPIALLLVWILARLFRQPAVRMVFLLALALGIASAWLAISWSTSHPNAAYYLPITRAFEFLMGVVLAIAVRKIKLSEDIREVLGIIGVLMVVYCLVRPMPVLGYPSYWALIPCTATALIIWAGVGSPTAVTRFLSLKFFVGLGLVSYGWYLWHWPLLVFGEAYNLRTPPLYVRIILILLALGIAALSYRFIEGIFYKRSGSVRKGRTWGPVRVVVAGVVAMSVVASLSWGGVALANGQAGESKYKKLEAELDDYPKMPADCLGQGQYIPDTPGKCTLYKAKEKHRPTVVLWGDSHAWMYIPAIEPIARKRDVNLVAFVMGACPPFQAPQTTGLSCARSNRSALNYVRNELAKGKKLRIILSASWETYLDSDASQLPAGINTDYLREMVNLFQAGSAQLFRSLADLKADVDVVGPTAIIPRSAPECEASDKLFSCDVSRTDAIAHEDEVDAWLRDNQRVFPAKHTSFIDVTPSLCGDSMCYAKSNDGTLNYFDDNHISASLSRKLKQYFVPTFRKLG